MQIMGEVTSAGSPASLYGRVHEVGGSGPYQIFSVKGRALKFMMGGKERFFARVTHPAALAKPFMGSSLAENEASIRSQLQQTLDEKLGRP
jgi:hypothetical protein